MIEYQEALSKFAAESYVQWMVDCRTKVHNLFLGLTLECLNADEEEAEEFEVVPAKAAKPVAPTLIKDPPMANP